MAQEKDGEIPETGAVFTYGRSKFADNEPNRFWIRDDPVVLIACGDEHTAVVTEKGRLFTFGSNDYGQLGQGNTKAHTSPTSVKALKGERVVLIACGKAHTVVCLGRIANERPLIKRTSVGLIADSDAVYSFGANEEGQLGTGDFEPSSTPRELRQLRGEKLRQLAAGAQHSMALTSDGHVIVWGCHSEGQLGLGRAQEQHCIPTDLPLKYQVVTISCGYHHSAIITRQGDLYTFGDGEGGKLGLGHDKTVTSPQKVDVDDKVEQVSCGGSHTAIVTENSRLQVFGDGQNGQLGLGNSKSMADEPTPVDKLHGIHIKYVDCGYSHTAAISDIHCLYVFGDARFGKLGLEGRENPQPAPKRVTRFSKFDVTQVSCGGSHTIIMGKLCRDWRRREEAVSRSSRKLKFEDEGDSEDEGLPESEESYPGGARGQRRRNKDEQYSHNRMSKSLDLSFSARENDMRDHRKLPPLNVERGRNMQQKQNTRYDSDSDKSPQRSRRDSGGSSDEGISESRRREERQVAKFRKQSNSSEDADDSRRSDNRPSYGRQTGVKDDHSKRRQSPSASDNSESADESNRASLRARHRSRSASDNESTRQRDPKPKRIVRRSSFDVPASKSRFRPMSPENEERPSSSKSSKFPSWLFKKKAQAKTKDKKSSKGDTVDERIARRGTRKTSWMEDKETEKPKQSKACTIS